MEKNCLQVRSRPGTETYAGKGEGENIWDRLGIRTL